MVTGPGHGTLTLNPSGSFTYTPSPFFAGTDSFTYRANDGTADSNTATATITVTPGNVTPQFTVTANVPVGEGPWDVAVSPDGSRVYVANSFGESVSVIDAATNTVTATIALGDRPYDVAVSPDGTRLYATDLRGGVSVIDTATNTVTATIRIQPPTRRARLPTQPRLSGTP